MIAVPAIDLRDGACVQLIGGAFDAEAVRIDDPTVALERWTEAGFSRLHVVDLDAAMGHGDNRRCIDELLMMSELSVQVGGGIRSSARVAQLFDRGANSVVVGTRAIEEPDWLQALCERYPHRIVVAADVRGTSVVTRGWTTTLAMQIDALVDRLNPLPLAGVLVTAVHVEGRLTGPDRGLIAHVSRRSTHPVVASGGIASVFDLRALAEDGAASAVIGMALYTGALDARSVAEEFKQ
jgi:phosphoribosylformimino-5-aminoimidazole carboxamide ribotide isomerase